MLNFWTSAWDILQVTADSLASDGSCRVGSSLQPVGGPMPDTAAVGPALNSYSRYYYKLVAWCSCPQQAGSGPILVIHCRGNPFTYKSCNCSKMTWTILMSWHFLLRHREVLGLSSLCMLRAPLSWCARTLGRVITRSGPMERQRWNRPSGGIRGESKLRDESNSEAVQLIKAHKWESGLFLKSDLLDDNKTVDGDNMHKNSLHNAKYRNPVNTISYQSTLILTKTSHDKKNHMTRI